MRANHEGRRYSRFHFISALRWMTPVLIVGCVFYFAAQNTALSQISSRQTSAPEFSPSSNTTEKPVTPKAPAQVELPPTPPMKIFPGLAEPLVATGPVTEEEGKDLDAALKEFHDAPAKAGPGGDYDDYAKPLLAFIAAHPQSNWNAAINLNLGLGYYHAGYYSRTFGYYEKAWQQGRNATSVPARRMIDRAVGELAYMHARIGHAKELEALFADMGRRPISGPAVYLIEGAHEGLGAFHGNQGIAYLCGPAALKNILRVQKATPKQIKVAEDARSGPHGFSLEQLAALADKAKLKYKLIRREAGQPIPVPSIINWDVHHYAAIVGMQGEKYRLQDPTFGSGGSVFTAKAIDAGGSGYFLVPASVIAANPKAGWHIVSAHSPEAKTVYGMGYTVSVKPGPVTHCDIGTSAQGGSQPSLDCPTCGCSNTAPPQPEPMAIASARIQEVSLALTDTPVGYKPQKGLPAYETLTYNSQDGDQPANFTFSNVSAQWAHSWQTYVQDDPTTPGNNVTRVISGGGGFDYAVQQSQMAGYYDATTGAFIGEIYDYSQLVRNPATGSATSYTRYLPDGSLETYGLSNGATTFPRLMFLTSVADPQGNTTTLTYDASFRLTKVTDATGRNTTFTYGLTGPVGQYLITKITDPFGRFSTLTYNAGFQLASITDPIGITSSFTYSAIAPTTFITQLTTPYGVSKFSDIPNPNDYTCCGFVDRSLAMTDPLGNAELLYLYQQDSVTNTPSTEAVLPTGMITDNTYLQWRNTYYWDRHAAAGGNVTTDSNGNPIAEVFGNPTSVPTIYHWFHQCCELSYVSNQLGSLKKPLEEYRQWFNYPEQPPEGYWSSALSKPAFIGRVLDDGSTQLSQATYNDPNDVPPPYTAPGNMLSSADPVGRATQYNWATNSIDLLTVQQLTAPSVYTTIATFGNYNTQHEPQTYTGADGQAWNYTYNAAGQLATVTDPNSGITTYTYDTTMTDTNGRLLNVKDANSDTVLTLTYDTSNRVKTRKDSQGYILTYAYDDIDRITSITYPDATTDLYDYTFQSGPNMGDPSLDLRKHTDRLGRVTTYNYDADRRLTSVVEPTSGTATRTTQYDYYENGTLKDIIDANGNDTRWAIDLQSRPTSKTYGFGGTSPQTETYAYEMTNSRLHSITDALGQVKTFTYAEDDRITGITYTGSVNTTPNVTLTWDPYFPRLASMTDGIGTTNYTYTAIGSLGALKLASVDETAFSNDTIGLTYDALGRLAGRTITGGNETFGYDAISRLTGHVTPLGSFTYTYLGQTDQTAKRTATNGTKTFSTTWTYDTNANDRRLIKIANTGVTRDYTLSYLNGTAQDPYDIMSIVDTAATGHPFATQTHNYTYDLIDRLLTASATTPGNDTYGYDNLDNATTYDTPASSTSPTYNGFNQIKMWGTLTYHYDADGNLTSGDGVKTYKWDAENRLIEIDYVGTSNKSVFSYDGLGHRTVDAETVSGTTTTTHYLWCGSSICQTRNASDTVLRRDLDEGEFNISTSQKLIYMPDQLGSARDVLDGTTGTLVDAFDYTPYGAPAQTSGTTPLDYHFAELYLHTESGLNLSLTRPIDGVTGRWINRDPMKERFGINLYTYANASPIRGIDPYGLWQITVTWGWGWAGQISFGNNGGSGLFNGQWNVGAYQGVGAGLSASLDLNNSGCNKPGTDWGVKESTVARLGHVGGDYGGELNLNGDASVTVSVDVPFGGLGGSLSSTGTPASVKSKIIPTVGGGESAFIGAGGTTTFGSCSCSQATQ